MNVEKKSEFWMQHSIQSDQPNKRKTFSFNMLKITIIVYVHSMFKMFRLNTCELVFKRLTQNCWLLLNWMNWVRHIPFWITNIEGVSIYPFNVTLFIEHFQIVYEIPNIEHYFHASKWEIEQHPTSGHWPLNWIVEKWKIGTKKNIPVELAWIVPRSSSHCSVEMNWTHHLLWMNSILDYLIEGKWKKKIENLIFGRHT